MSTIRMVMGYSGKWRRKRIRAMVRMGAEELAPCCRERGVRYLRFLGAEAPEVLTAHAFSWWHDSEYALSLALGYYDPASELSRAVMAIMRRQGHEVLPADLERHRRVIVAAVARAACTDCGRIPLEYGYIARMVAKSEPGKHAGAAL